MYSPPVMVTSVEYYRTQDKRSRAENMQYYTDNEGGTQDEESYGVWRVPTNASGQPYTDQIEDGKPVLWETIDKVSRGIDPTTGEPFFERTKENKYVAIDATNSAPKPVSILLGTARAAAAEAREQLANPGLTQVERELWVAKGNRAERIAEIVLNAHTNANNKSLDFLYDIGAFQTRQGAGSKERAGATYYASAQFTHFTSRDGDMQVHTHNVIPNVGRREDGELGALDNYKFNSYRGAASAVYRADMFQSIKRELAELGIEVSVSKDGRNLTIDGVSEDLCVHFSKRRAAILKQMHDKGYSNTANHTQAAQIASYKTRGSKDRLPPIEDLYRLWNVEAKALGHTFDSIIESIDLTARKMKRDELEKWEAFKLEAKENGEEITLDKFAYDFAKLKETATERVMKMEAAFESRHFMTATLEQLQAHVGADEALRLYEEVKAESGLVEIGTRGRAKETMYSTEAMLQKEFEILDMAAKMQGNRTPIPGFTIEARLAKGITPPSGKTFYLTPEQENMVFAMLSDNQMTATTGDAGTGKTTVMKVVCEIAEAEGLEPVLSGPTNRSVDELRSSVGIAPDRAMTVSKILSDHARGKLKLTERNLLIVDEAGMIGSANWHALERVAIETGARINFVGDYKQLPPVEAGAPMRMVVEQFGGARLAQIARQDDEWQREASKMAASGRIADAIDAYDAQGCIVICEDADDLEKRAVNRFFELRDTQPGSIVMLATTNAEVARLNTAIRAAKIERGELTGEAVSMEAITRGTDGKRTEISLMQGDRIIIGETVYFGGVGGERFSNNSFGTVEKITPSDTGEAILTVKWDDGRTLSFKPSEFVGRREEDDKLKALPKIAIADAMTFYASQGMTAKHCINASKATLTTESAYVGMTRHKTTYTCFIDGSRHANDIATGAGKVFTMSKKGGTRQEDDEPDTAVSNEQIMEHYKSETGKASGKNNACDFLGGSKEFYERYKSAESGNREESEMQTEKKGEIAKPAFLKNGSGSLSEANANGYGSGSASAGNADKKQSGERRAPSLDDNEQRYVKEYDLISFIARHQVSVDRSKSILVNDKKSKGAKARQYVGSGPMGKVMIFERSNGEWSYWVQGATDNKGDIRNFVQMNVINKPQKSGFYEASIYLRNELGTESMRGPSSAYVAPKTAAAFVQETKQQIWERLSSSASYVAEKFQELRAKWEGREAKASGYLLNERGITVDTQRYFANSFRCEGASPQDGQNKGGVAFQMTDYAGNHYGANRRGPSKMRDDKSGELVPFNKMDKDTERRAIIGGDPRTADVIYTGEAPIDLMSAVQDDGILADKSGRKVAYVACAGNAAEGPLSVIYSIAKDRGQSVEWVRVRQNDTPNKAGQKMDEIYSEQIREAITTGCPQAKISDKVPPQQFEDWNDKIRNKSRPIPKSAAEVEADAKATREAMEARQRAKAAYEGIDHTPTPSKGRDGPSMG